MLQKYWELGIENLFQELGTRKTGLTDEEVIVRQGKSGKNELSSERKRTVLQIVLSQFNNPLLIVLMVVSIASGFLGDISSSLIVFLIIIFSCVVSFFQEYKSEKIVQMLKEKVVSKTLVIRNGKSISINSHDLVVGDIVVLDFGQVVPADLRLFESSDLAFNEAALTGESFPVEKNIKSQRIKNYLPQSMKNIAFMGTGVTQGFGKGVVIAIGKDTEYGRTVRIISGREEPSHFQRGIADFSLFLFKIVVTFSLATFFILALLKGNWLESLLFALSIAVGISPELLPVIITINLSRAASLMAKKEVIVKKLISIEDLGNADILCTDKTGTLTEGKITLKDYFDYSGKKNGKLLEFARLCNSLNFSKRSNNPLDHSINEYIEKNKHELCNEKFKTIENIAFDFERRRMSVIADNSERLIITKGAEEEMLSVCRYCECGSGKEPITKHIERIRKMIRDNEKKGFKVLLIGYKEIEVKKGYGVGDENDLIFLGCLTFSDPPKKDALASLERLRRLGISIKLLTGDTEATAKFLAKEMKFDSERIVLGADLEKMNEVALSKAVDRYDIFAKTTPELKLKIVNALKKHGHCVAFMGDGINDAPALRAADVGISVDSATDIAKEAADVILLKKNLEVLIEGIKEGRRTFGNTIKYIFCTISSNYGNMFSVVVASIFLPFMPLLPVQILLLNFLSDFPLLAVSTDKVDSEYLKKPKQWDISKIRKFMNYFGVISSAFDFITFAILLLIFNASISVFQGGWFWESFMTEVLLIFAVRTRKWFWQSKPSKALMTTFFVTIFIVLLIICTPLGSLFGFGRMPLQLIGCLLVIGVLYFAVVELGKKAFYKYNDI
ncbi:MAG: magnesium-translocating P-type ATPase [Candidatus Pacebacteria bacterium]|nr:magnesium-translocating P-type ATPase [Candidatus Paceibacterota bacterium]